MKKSIFTLSAIALVAFGISSCQKEEAAQLPKHFRASAENSAKTTLNSELYTEWEATDQIRIGFQGTNNGVVYTASPDQTDPTWADFSTSESIPNGTPLYAVYPANIAQGQRADRVCLPAVQNSTNGSFAGAPMVADFSSIEPTDGMRVQFQNLCGVMKIHLQQGGVNISEIAVIADQQLNGTYTISYTDGVPALTSTTATAPNTASRITTLVLGEAPSISDGKDFYIYLPAGNYTNMQLRIKNSAGNYCTKTCAAVTINRNEIVPITIGGDMGFLPPAMLDGYAFFTNNSLTSITFHYNSNVTSDINKAINGTTPIYWVNNSGAVDLYTSASVIVLDNYGGFFFGCNNLQSINFGEGFNTDNVLDMSGMFNQCANLTSLDLSTFSSNGNPSILGMFFGCTQLTSIKFNHNFTPSNTEYALWNVSNCTVYCNETLKGMLQNNGIGSNITYITTY